MPQGKSKFFLYFFVFAFLLFVSYVYYQRIGGFSFGDEWNKFMLAYFMLKGNVLYGQIFSNHQMLSTYVSFLIQKIGSPETLYQLVLEHRLFVIAFSFLFDVLLVFRFGLSGMGFALLFESTKYYLFGHLFLPESFVAYFVVYLFGLAWHALQKAPLSRWDYIAATVFAWCTVFLREPYIPVALLLYAVILIRSKKRFAFLGLFLALSLLTFLPIVGSLQEYISQVLFFNVNVMVPNEVRSQGPGFIKTFFYPLVVLFEGKWNFFRHVLIVLDILFLTLFAYYLLKTRRFRIGGLVIVVLGLAALRFVEPGTIYFEAFHALPWYGLFVMSTFLLLFAIAKKKELATKLILLLVVVLFGYTISGRSFLWEKVDKDALFTENYAHYYINGEVIRTLSEPKDTLFTDMWDYLIHWQAKLDSPYSYSIYTFAMRGVSTYDDARIAMFKNNPPDFYYTLCQKDVYQSELLPKEILSAYAQLYRDGKPTCTYVKKGKLTKISEEQWDKAKSLGFTLP